MIVLVIAATTMILFYLAAGPAADIVHDVIKQDINNPDLTAADLLLTEETVIIWSVYIVSCVSVLKSARSTIISMIAIPLGYLAMLVVSLFALLIVTNWQFSLATWWIMPVLFACYILGNPATYLIILSAILLVLQGILLKITKVKI